MRRRQAMALWVVAWVMVEPGCKSRRAHVVVAGSSTVFPVTEAMAEEFGQSRPGAQVTVAVTGTGGGFKKFCAGQTDISNASRPIKATEVEACAKAGVSYVEVPVAYDAVVVVVNPQNRWAQEISVEELKTLWEPAAQQKVTRWNQVRPSWPDLEVHLFGPGVDSGTYDYFTEAIVHREHASRGDYTAAVDPNVLTSGVANDELALGFFSMAYFWENRDKLKIVAVADPSRQTSAGPVLPTVETVRQGTYEPLSRPVFIYVAVRSLDRSEVREFVDFYLQKAPTLVETVGLVALPPRAYDLDAERVARRRVGSLFSGRSSRVRIPIEALLEQDQTRSGQSLERP